MIQCSQSIDDRGRLGTLSLTFDVRILHQIPIWDV